MSPDHWQDHMQNQRSAFIKLAFAAPVATFAMIVCAQQNYTLPDVPYGCNGRRLVIENCNIRDLSDARTCLVGHLDDVMPNGLMQYTNMTRAA